MAVVAVLGAMAVGAGTSVGMGYALEMTIGDKHYSRRDFAIDATLGAVGVGTATKIGKAGYHTTRYAIRLRRAEKAGDTAKWAGKGDDFVFGVTRYADDLAKFEKHKGEYGYHTAIRAQAEYFRDGEPRTYYDPVNFDGEGRGLNQIREMIEEELVTRYRRRLTQPTPGRRAQLVPCRCKDGSYSVNCC